MSAPMLGQGLLKGLAETARNFLGSYVKQDRLVTVQYPEERLPPAEAARNFPFLVYDGDDWQKGLRCVACLICEKECPPQCIYIVPERDERGKPKKHPRLFDIDISVCMSCQICVEVCPFDAIKMDQEFELSRTDRFDGLLLHKNDLAKSNQYYQKIHPAEAAAVDAQLAAERQRQAAKARAAAASTATKAGLPSPAEPSPPVPASPAISAPPPAAEGLRGETNEAGR